MQRPFLIFFSVFLLVFTQVQAQPSTWLDDDWNKFIELAVTTVLGETYSHAGGVFPVVDVYSALSAVGGSTKLGLQLWLRAKIADAYSSGNYDQGDHYNLFYSCLTWGGTSCEDLVAVQALSGNPSTSMPAPVITGIQGSTTLKWNTESTLDFYIDNLVFPVTMNSANISCNPGNSCREREMTFSNPVNPLQVPTSCFCTGDQCDSSLTVGTFQWIFTDNRGQRAESDVYAFNCEP